MRSLGRRSFDLGALFAVTLAALALTPRAAAAQPGGTIDLQQFRPARASKGYITVNASQVLGSLDFSFGLVTSWARHPLRFDGPVSCYGVNDLVTPQLQAAMGLFGFAELGVGLPLTVVSGSATGATGGSTPGVATLGWQGAGDLQLHLKARLLPVWRYPVGIAALVTVTVPTGTTGAWIGEGQATVQPSLILEREFGAQRRWRVGLNVGARIRPHALSFTDADTPGRVGTHDTLRVGTELLYGAALSYTVAPARLDVIAELFGSLGKQSAQALSRTAPVEGVAGIKVYLAHNSFFLLGAGGGLNANGYGSPQVRVFGAFIFEPRVGDRDGDGVPDDVDQCPNEPGPRANLGCPDADRDGDGVPDRLDACPDQPGPSETHGCPTDDRDGDGVPDRLDKCPDVAGTKENDGCPDARRVIIRHGELHLLDKIYFETNKAVIKPESFPILNAIAIVLQANPQITRVEIGGHADARGSHAHNDWLTAERARAVLEYVAAHGVDRGRLTSQGYGKRKPLCSENAEECWVKNRRVEFVILERTDKQR